MIFYTPNFWFIFLTGLIAYYLTNAKSKWTLLLGGSIIFIGALSLPFLLYALLFTVANYYFGLALFRKNEPEKRKRLYLLFLIINIGQLAFFKYLNFIIENLNVVTSLFNFHLPYIKLLVPLGISYYTFQSIGYMINVYRKTEKPEKHFGYFLIYNLLFPKFLSGPIERSNRFFPQLHNLPKINPVLFEEGVLFILTGFFKKLIIAERLSVVVNNLYGNLDHFNGYPLWIIMFLQTIYIYTDFSGYTDIALGIGKLLGFNLTNNFNRPFFSPNVSVFWRRWHISLSSWFNDYMFKTIMFKKRKWGNMAAIYAVFMTFLVIGIWHGANWTFVILGLLQGIAISYEYFTKRTRLKIGSKIPRFLNDNISRLITFIFMSFSLIFFFAPNLQDAIYYVTHLFNFSGSKIIGHNLGLDHYNLGVLVVAFLSLIVIETLIEYGYDLKNSISNKPFWLRWTAYYGLTIIIFLFSYFSTSNFIYAKF